MTKRRYYRPYKSRKRYKPMTANRVRAIARAVHNKMDNRTIAYTRDDHSRSLACAHNEVIYAAFNTLADRSDIETMIEDELALGTVKTGVDNTDNILYKLYDFKGQVHLRNMSPHAINLVMYEIVARRNMQATGAANMTSAVMESLVDGWEGEGAASVDAVVGAKTANTNIAADGYTSTHTSKHIWPKQSFFFQHKFKIVKRKKFHLQAGDDVYWNFTMPSKLYNPAQEQAPDGIAEHVDYYKGLTRCFMVKMWGDFGHDTTDQTLVGYMSADLAIEFSLKYKGFQVFSTRNDYEISVTTDNLTTAALEGPSAHVMTVDD